MCLVAKRMCGKRMIGICKEFEVFEMTLVEENFTLCAVDWSQNESMF